MIELYSVRLAPLVQIRATELLHGCCDVELRGSWAYPQRFLPAQKKALGSVGAWHPGLYRQMAACTAGVTLEFTTDCTALVIELLPGELPRGSRAMLNAAHAWATPPELFDAPVVQIDGQEPRPIELEPLDTLASAAVTVAAADNDPAQLGEPQVLKLQLAEKSDQPCLPGFAVSRRVRVWLPCLSPCAVRMVYGWGGTAIEAVMARPVFLALGDSITQGFTCGRPQAAWPHVVAEHLGMDVCNQGIGGQVFQAGALAGISVLSPSAAVVCLGENYRFEAYPASRAIRDVRMYLAELARELPTTPIWIVMPLPYREGTWPTHPQSCYAEVVAALPAEVARYDHMRLVDGSTLLDREKLCELLADGVDHPTAAGHEQIATRLLTAMGGVRKAAEHTEPPATEPTPAATPKKPRKRTRKQRVSAEVPFVRPSLF